MRRSPPRHRRALLIPSLLVAALAGSRGASAQEVVDVAGQVVDVQTGQPLEGVGITIRGTWLRTLTNQDGRFVLRGVPVGEQVWVIERLGYATWEQPLTARHLDQLRIGLLARPVALEEIRVSVDRLEARRKLAPFSVHTMSREDLRSSAAIDAADLARSRMPWIPALCAAADSDSPLEDPGQPITSPTEICIRYRGSIVRPGVCLDDRPVPLIFLFAYSADEIYAIDYIGGPRPQIRAYTERFLESGRPIRPIAFGCH